MSAMVSVEVEEDPVVPRTATRVAAVVPASVLSTPPEMDARIRPDGEGTMSTEVRWFVPGNGPLPRGVPVRSCIDSYRLDMLAAGVSVKSRAGHGAGVFVKLRSAVLTPLAIGVLRGMPATWARWEIGEIPESAAMVHVHKVIARRKGVEIAQLVLQDEEWWSVAVRVRGPELPCLPSEIESHLRHRSGDARCSSYPAWLGLRTSDKISCANGCWTL